jgi:hypothetical protein
VIDYLAQWLELRYTGDAIKAETDCEVGLKLVEEKNDGSSDSNN